MSVGSYWTRNISRGISPRVSKWRGCDASSSLNADTITDDMACAATPEIDGRDGVVKNGTPPAVKCFSLLKRSRMGPDREHTFDTGDSTQQLWSTQNKRIRMLESVSFPMED